MLRCTEWWHRVEKKGVPNTPSLLNVNDTHHFEHLMWTVYDGTLLVGRRPELPGNHQWGTVLVELYKHIYKGCDDAAHCPPYTLDSWDCPERLRHFIEREIWALHGVSTREHPGPGEDLGTILDATPGHQP